MMGSSRHCQDLHLTKKGGKFIGQLGTKTLPVNLVSLPSDDVFEPVFVHANVDHMKTKLIKEAHAKEMISVHWKEKSTDLPSLPTRTDVRAIALPSVFSLVGSHAITKGSITDEESVKQFSTHSNTALWLVG